MNKIKSFGMCVGLAAGISAFILCMLVGNTKFVNFLWVGFLSMIIYFAAGGNKDWKLAGRMICTFGCGLLWGQLSNLIYVLTFDINPILASVLDYFVLVAVLVWVHLSLLNKTPCNFLPTAFLGLACTIGFFGRPFPYAGMGLAGDMAPGMIIVYLVFYMIFGLVFSLMINYIGGFLAKHMLKQSVERHDEQA